jgi:hypothetical protein
MEAVVREGDRGEAKVVREKPDSYYPIQLCVRLL